MRAMVLVWRSLSAIECAWSQMLLTAAEKPIPWPGDGDLDSTGERANAGLNRWPAGGYPTLLLATAGDGACWCCCCMCCCCCCCCWGDLKPGARSGCWNDMMLLKAVFTDLLRLLRSEPKERDSVVVLATFTVCTTSLWPSDDCWCSWCSWCCCCCCYCCCCCKLFVFCSTFGVLATAAVVALLGVLHLLVTVCVVWSWGFEPSFGVSCCSCWCCCWRALMSVASQNGRFFQLQIHQRRIACGYLDMQPMYYLTTADNCPQLYVGNNSAIWQSTSTS